MASLYFSVNNVSSEQERYSFFCWEAGPLSLRYDPVSDTASTKQSCNKAITYTIDPGDTCSYTYNIQNASINGELKALSTFNVEWVSITDEELIHLIVLLHQALSRHGAVPSDVFQFDASSNKLTSYSARMGYQLIVVHNVADAIARSYNQYLQICQPAHEYDHAHLSAFLYVCFYRLSGEWFDSYEQKPVTAALYAQRSCIRVYLDTRVDLVLSTGSSFVFMVHDSSSQYFSSNGVRSYYGSVFESSTVFTVRSSISNGDKFQMHTHTSLSGKTVYVFEPGGQSGDTSFWLSDIVITGNSITLTTFWGLSWYACCGHALLISGTSACFSIILSSAPVNTLAKDFQVDNEMPTVSNQLQEVLTISDTFSSPLCYSREKHFNAAVRLLNLITTFVGSVSSVTKFPHSTSVSAYHMVEFSWLIAWIIRFMWCDYYREKILTELVGLSIF